MKIKIRKINSTDCNKMRRLVNRAIAEELPHLPGEDVERIAKQNSLKSLLVATKRKHRLLLGVFVGRKLVGYLIADSSAPSDTNIFWIYVVPEMRNNGYGTSLLKKGLLLLSDRGAVQAYISLVGDMSFYEQVGFEPISEYGMVRNLTAI